MTGTLRRPGGGLAIAAALAVLAVKGAANGLLIREFPAGIGTAPAGIAVGDASRCAGFVWFTEYTGGTRGSIGKAGGGGVIEEFPIPASDAGGAPLGITCGPSPAGGGAYQALWFALRSGIGALTIFDQFFLFTRPTDSRPWDITLDSDGNLWFTEANTAQDRIVKFNPLTGAVIRVVDITTTPDPEPYGITAGPPGTRYLWFTEYGGNRIGKIEQDPPYAIDDRWVLRDPNSGPWGIAVGPDNNIWFTEELANKIGRIDPTSGRKDEWAIPPGPHPDPWPEGITAGPSTSPYSRLWFAGSKGNYIGQINTSGLFDSVFAYPVPKAGSTPRDITSVPGYLWFAEFEGDQIGLVDLEVEPPPDEGVPCQGDCNNNGEVTRAELITMVAVDLGAGGPDGCETGAGGDGQITAEDILAATNNVATQCGKNATALACSADGGTFGLRDCCSSATDFPDVCGIGACGCPPTSSVPTWVCTCGEGHCFDGEHCVGAPA